MELPSAFKFPSKAGQPLHTLSPERVNGSRPASSISNTTSHKSSKYTESESDEPVISQYSPTRKAKVDPFRDHPTTPNKSLPSFALPQSPSLPDIHALRAHGRTNSDVQGLVKRFEHLDVRDRDAESVERKRRHEAELRRAQIAREEAESDVKRLREEVRRLKRDGEEGHERERKVARRLEVVMEELGTTREQHGSQHAVYEKELRKGRKEVFKSSSTVVKLQEELKATRNTLRNTHSGFELEKQKVQQKEQERFEMEYQFIPMQEELEQVKQKLRVSEEQREALKRNVKEEEVARIAAEGLIALPASQDMDLDLASSRRKHDSPQKRAPSPLSDDKENMGVMPKKAALESRRLANELERERMRREHAEELVEFMRMECVFRCCGCKMAARLGHEFGLELDAELAVGVERVRAGMEGILTPPVDVDEPEQMEFEVAKVEEIEVMEKMEVAVDEIAEVNMELVRESTMPDEIADRSMTFGAESPAHTRTPEVDQPQVDEVQSELHKAATPPPPSIEKETSPMNTATEAPVTVPLEPQTPPTHHRPGIRTITTTTTVPMQFTPLPKPSQFSGLTFDNAENIPPTPQTIASGLGTADRPFDREAALAAIQYRRGRAKSLAAGQVTPRKQMVEGVKERRDISAPALGQGMKGGGIGAKVGSGSLNGRR